MRTANAAADLMHLSSSVDSEHLPDTCIRNGTVTKQMDVPKFV